MAVDLKRNKTNPPPKKTNTGGNRGIGGIRDKNE